MTSLDGSIYYQGRPCKYGHAGIRYISTSGCVDCNSRHNREWQRDNRERKNQLKRESAQRNPEGVRVRARRYRIRHRERDNEQSRRWARNNPHKSLARTVRRQATKHQAMPPWHEVNACKKVYEKARQMGGQVDHVVPLKSRLVCGLHCWDNLQVLPRGMNQRKGNSMWPDMPESVT